MELSNNLLALSEAYEVSRNLNLKGRYVTYNHIEPEIEKFRNAFLVEEVGASYLNVPIPSITIGRGKIKILAWSQMHGNESTTTKAVFDLLNLFHKTSIPETEEILSACTIKIIPMLNPDGAVRYTRENVNGVDLNRDAQDLSQPESQVLRNCLNAFQPNFCFNLHDQRTIFSAGNYNKPASISFLSPSIDHERSITESREISMQLIAAVNHELQQFIPGQVGRYDDAFNINCTGDTIQSLNIPCLLFEAGFLAGDYLREESRKYIFFAIFAALLRISRNDFEKFQPEDYFGIPENQKKFFDVILKNAKIAGKVKQVAIQYKEIIKSGEVEFLPVIHKITDQLQCCGHKIIDCKGKSIYNISGEKLCENDIVQQILLNDDKITIKSK